MSIAEAFRQAKVKRGAIPPESTEYVNMTMQMDGNRLEEALTRRDVDVDFYTFEAATSRWPAITVLTM